MNFHIETGLPKELPARKKLKWLKESFFWKESESENICIESGLPKELFLQLERKWKKNIHIEKWVPVPCLWIYRDAHSSNYNNKAARFLHRKWD